LKIFPRADCDLPEHNFSCGFRNNLLSLYGKFFLEASKTYESYKQS
jgi:hypothetical protein